MARGARQIDRSEPGWRATNVYEFEWEPAWLDLLRGWN